VVAEVAGIVGILLWKSPPLLVGTDHRCSIQEYQSWQTFDAKLLERAKQRGLACA